MNSAALILIDMQNDYCHPDGVFAQKAKFPIETIPPTYQNVNKLVSAFRKKQLPVIWIKMIWDNDDEVGILGNKSLFLKYEGLRNGTWGSEIVAELDVQPTDIIIEKKRFSAFYMTDLQQKLEELGIKRLVIGGVRTDFCVESTVRDAFFRDYDVIVASDCVASYFEALHQGSLNVMGTVFAKIMGHNEIFSLLAEDLQPPKS